MRSPNFSGDYAWSNLWMPTVKDLIGGMSGAWAHLLENVSGTDEDFKRATDLMSRRGRIAVRVRKPGARDKYYWHITITAWRESRYQCEFDKLLEDGDLMFYGHATAKTPDRGSITPWFLLDMKRWKPIERQWRHEETYQKNRNVAGEECRWYWYDVRNLMFADPRIILASSTAVPPLSLKQIDYDEYGDQGGE
jgi:hypothetical protein